MSVEFLDSNVFVYLFDATDDRKRGIARDLIDAALQDDSACISHQVVQETLNVVTRKFARPLTAEAADRFMQHSLLPLWRVMPSAALYARGLQLQQRWRLSFYDALIVAAALEAGCTRLLSEDLQHGQRIEGLRIENPFRT
jgi:predicted nucleic acid-binding protein